MNFIDRLPTELVRFGFVLFCDLPSILNLCLVQKQYVSLDAQLRATHHWTKIIGRRLLTLGLDLDTLSIDMKESQALLSGSFLLQCVLGETWSKSDVDFFVPAAHYIADWGLKRHMWLWIKGDETRMSKSTHQYVQFSDEYDNVSLAVTVYNYAASELGMESPDLQVIVMNATTSASESPYRTLRGKMDAFRELAIERFDLDFCKISFDGNNLVTHHIHAIRTKSAPLPRESWRPDLKTRVTKYRDRGFTIEDERKRPLPTPDENESAAPPPAKRHRFERSA